MLFVFFFKQKTAYEILTCDWSSDVCSSDLAGLADCYAVIVLADIATFLLAANRIAAFRSDSAIMLKKISSSRGSVGRASALIS